MSTIVSRFGGNAAANSREVKIAAEIVKSDPSRRYVIVSAPGSTSDNLGVTDLLYLCHSRFNHHEDYIDIIESISARYKEIIEGIGIEFDLDSEINTLRQNLESKATVEFIASRGEYIMSKIFAKYLNWDFIDAADLIFFNKNGTPDKAKTYSVAGQKLKNYERAIIPSFYGTDSEGKILTCTRGDCDTAGALIACAMKADLFEKWSETAKIFSADPAIIPHSAVINHITYDEALEMNYIGLEVMKDSVVFMLKESGIPMKLFSAHHPESEGMFVSPSLPENLSRNPIVCIAGHKNFNVINIQKYGLNKNYEFEEKLFPHFAKHHIASRHYISGIHKMSIILKNPRFDLERNEILKEIKQAINPDSITVEKGMSLIALVGEGIGTTEEIFYKIFSVLHEAKIKVNLIDHGSDKLNIIIGVFDSDFEKTIKVLYDSVILNYNRI